MQHLFVFFTISSLFCACNNPESSSSSTGSESIDGYYELVSGNDKCTLTITGSRWRSKCIETIWGQTIVSGNGTVQGNRLLGEYGNEVGYISGSSATINISGSGITLYKQ